jgi:TPR repeat protein
METVSRQTAPVLEKMYQFMLWLVPTVDKFPRAQKFLLGDRIQGSALDVLEGLVEAAYTKPRGPILARVNLGLEKLRSTMPIWPARLQREFHNAGPTMIIPMPAPRRYSTARSCALTKYASTSRRSCLTGRGSNYCSHANHTQPSPKTLTYSQDDSMKVINCSLLFILALSTSTVANAAGSKLRITCEGDDVGAEVLINGKFRGECPIDLAVPAGRLKLLVRKDVDAQHERFFEQEIRMGEDSAKKVDATLSSLRLNTAGQQLEDQRLTAERAEAAKLESRKLAVEALKLGTKYFKGEGVAQSYEQAALWYRKAADADEPGAMNNLGVLYENGRGVAQSYEQAALWYRKAADAGEPTAMRNLGLLYEGGRGVAQNYEQAALWYRKAAEAGVSNAMNSLGLLYESGGGVAQSYEQAVIWYRKAAEAGVSNAMNSLGLLYESGRGVAQSYEQAAIWYRKAAEGGQVKAMYRLGLLYEVGMGVDRSNEQAVLWYRKAADKGSAPAIDELKKRGLL